MSLAIYPGTFDPITNGHIDIISRGLNVFDKLVVVVAYNARKTGLFSVEERVELIRQSVPDPRVDVDSFEGLLVDYAESMNAKVVLRGLRAVADFEFEFQMANMNRKLNNEMETFFMMSGAGNFYVSSSLVREVASLGGKIDDLVPLPVSRALKARFGDDA
ncbi:MAG TPA: pantetheine-phosphate adenylyltransferase [Myxococcales bacterium]|nr:pantetheine-phosphate adenylyltransferase [Myxococcales bacterium]HIN86397.1 pantetheine-phosphate adenylyltransferase [Myxococcales bacterium]